MSAHQFGAMARAMTALKENFVHITATGQVEDLSQDWTYFKVKNGVTSFTLPLFTNIPDGMTFIVDNTSNLGAVQVLAAGGGGGEMASGTIHLAIISSGVLHSVNIPANEI